MSSSLLSPSILDVATPFSDAAVRSFDTDRAERARLEERRQSHLAAALEKKSELLSSPDKIDNMVAGNLEDIYPLAKRPTTSGLSRVNGIDESLSKNDHPMAGIGKTVRDNFVAALKDKRYAAAAPHEILEAVKQETVHAKGEDGKSLLDKAHDYKLQKDQGGLFSFHLPFTEHSDKNTVALPGYEEYKAKNERAHTSIPEAFAIGAATTAVTAGLAALTGGAAAPLTAVLGRMAISGAIAVPEFKVFDAAINAVKDSEIGQDESGSKLGKLGIEMAAGIVATLATHKIAKFGLDKGLSAAIEAGKISEGATTNFLKSKGMATEAIKVMEAKNAEVATMKQVQTGLEAANAEVARKAATARKAQEVMVAASKDEADMPMDQFLARLRDEHLPQNLVHPEHATIMGLDEHTLELAKSNPAVLFTKIDNPEIEDKVMESIAGGMPAQDAVLKGFKEEASLRMMKQGMAEQDAAIADAELARQKASGEFVYPDAQRLGLPLSKGVKVTKGRAVNVATRASEIDFSNSTGGELVSDPYGIGLGKDTAKKVSGGNVKGEVNLTNDMQQLVEEVPAETPQRYEVGAGGKKVTGGSTKLPAGKTLTDTLGNKVEITPPLPEVIPPRYEVGAGGKKVSGGNTNSGNDVLSGLTNAKESSVDHLQGGLTNSANPVDPYKPTGKSSAPTIKPEVSGGKLNLENILEKDPVTKKPAVSGKKLADVTLKGVAAVTGSVALASILQPSDAQAASGPLAGLEAGKVVVDTLLEKAGGKVENVFKVLLEKNLVSEQVPLGTTTLPTMQKQFIQAPELGRGVKGYNEVVGKTKTPFDGFAQFMSTNFFSQVYGTTNRSVAVQLASMQNAMTNNINNATTVAKSILQNVKTILPEHSKEIAEFMKPVQAAYDEVTIPMRAAELQIIAEKESVKKIRQALADGKYTSEDAAALVQEKEDNIAKLNQVWSESNQKFASADAQYQAAKEELIQKYPSARISYAIEDPKLIERYAHLYTTEEKVAVAQFKEFYGHYKLRANEVGLETISGDYINHSRDNTKVLEEAQKRMEEMGIRVSKDIPLTEFYSRSKYSKQMVPDISRNVYDYIPDAERRIQGADFWRKGRQDGWYAFSQNDLIRSNKVWSEYFDRIKQSMVPPPNTTLNQWANRYASVETLRLLAFLPSAPFKHLFKNEGTWATLGFTHSMKMIPEAVMTSARNVANEALLAKGITDKMLPKGAMDDLARSLIKQRSMINPLADLERPEHIVSAVDQWLDKLNGVGGIGIRAVEAFDRTHTVQAALDMALKKGMTTEQAMFSIYDTILKNNFLGGSLNPAWMHNPKIRALALFQNTPFKIMERRLANAYKTGQDVRTAWGVIKSQKVEETLNQLMDLKAFVQSGQNEFKKNLIYDALTSTKDAMGNSVTHQFMKEFLITGAILGAGSATGVDFSGHSFHIPFLKSGTHEPVLATSPIVDASWKTMTGKPSPGHENDEEKEFFTARFLRHWLQSSGGAQPLLLHKFRRISEDDIPAIYKDSPLRYMFSVPSKVEH